MKPVTLKHVFILTAAAVFFSLIPVHTEALEWPVVKPEIKSQFGQETAYSVERGLILEGEPTVRTAGDGILLTIISESSNMTGFPSTLGNAVLMSHDDGLVSIYGNLKDTNRISGRVQIEKNTVLSTTGKTAWGNRENICIFQIMDQKQEVFLNPLLLLPPVEDNRSPVIKNVFLESASGQVFETGNPRRLRSGTYKIYALITDTYTRNPVELAPFRISVIINGIESISVPFETLRETGGMLVPKVTPPYLDGTVPLYNKDGFIYAGDVSLTRGRTEITVSARDFSGNERASVVMVQVD